MSGVQRSEVTASDRQIDDFKTSRKEGVTVEAVAANGAGLDALGASEASPQRPSPAPELE